MQKFELLAPAGSLASLKAAVNAGADAVYIGGSIFGARAYADNPETDELIEGIRYCHLRGRKLFLTVNTLFKEEELENKLIPFLKPYYEAGLDAVIVQDTGAMELISEVFPDMPIHISTQAAITMAEGANRLKERFPSITRVVPARELSLAELQRFRQDCSLEMEVFVHGALCYSCSGQCLLSSMIGGRSGNRGRCAQPCRKLYDGRYLLSPKDQCVLANLHELMKAGIDSFKIEGRMKSPEYTAGVVSVYRKYIDRYTEMGCEAYCGWLEGHRRELDRDIDYLKELYNRGGFTEGYLHKYNGPDMMTFDRPNHSGIEVGEVIAVRGREAVICFNRQVYAQDVLEIRDGNSKCFEFTLGQGFDKGETFSAITMKGRNAVRGMKVFRTRCNELLNEIDCNYIDKILKVPVKGSFKAALNQAMILSLSICSENMDSCDRIEIEIEGQIAEASKNAPSTEEGVRKQLIKLGDTPFEMKELVIDIEDGLFIPSGALNNMRREAAKMLEQRTDELYRRTFNESYESGVNDKTEANLSDDLNMSECDADVSRPAKVFSIWSKEQLDPVIDAFKDTDDRVDIYYNMSSYKTEILDDMIKFVSESGINGCLYVGLPYVSRADVYDRLKEFVDKICASDPEIRFLARTREEAELLDKAGCEYRTDYNIYGMNKRALNALTKEFTLPQELNGEELRQVATKDAELIVYGFQPVMFSAQCVYKNKFGKCRGIVGADFTSFTDELGHDFRARQLCAFCTNVIYNSARLDLTDRMDKINELGIGRIRYDFTFENVEEIRKILAGDTATDGEHCTGGHFSRGVM